MNKNMFQATESDQVAFLKSLGLERIQKSGCTTYIAIYLDRVYVIDFTEDDNLTFTHEGFAECEISDIPQLLFTVNDIINSKTGNWKAYLAEADRLGACKYELYLSQTFHLSEDIDQFSNLVQNELAKVPQLVEEYLKESERILSGNLINSAGLVESEFSRKLNRMGSLFNAGIIQSMTNEIPPERHMSLGLFLEHLDSDLGDILSMRIVSGLHVEEIKDTQTIRIFDFNEFIKNYPNRKDLASFTIEVSCTKQDVTFHFKQMEGSSSKSLFYLVTATRSGIEGIKLQILPKNTGVCSVFEVRLSSVDEDYWELKYCIDELYEKDADLGAIGLNDEQSLILQQCVPDVQRTLYWGMKYFNQDCLIQALEYFKSAYDQLSRSKQLDKNDSDALRTIAYYIGMLYLKLNRPDCAFYYLSVAKSNGDYVALGYWMTAQCELHTPGVTDRLEDLYQQSLESEELRTSNMFVLIRRELIEMYIRDGRLEDAELLLDEMEENRDDLMAVFHFREYLEQLKNPPTNE